MKYTLLLALLVISNLLQAQDSLVTNIATKNMTTFSMGNNKFSSEGWNKLLEEVKEHRNVAIGEDHFINEIPFFASQLATEVKFDNFFGEIDPFSAKIIEDKIKTLSANGLNDYTLKFGSTFSFYALAPDFSLLKI